MSFMLLLTRGADLHARDNLGRTCLHISILNAPFREKREFLSLVYLINSGADVFAVDNAGESVSDYAYSPTLDDKCFGLGGYRGDLWDAALVRCGYGIYGMREKYPRTPKYRAYSRSDFEMLWSGFEHLCPYYHDPPVWPPEAELVEDGEEISDEDISDEDSDDGSQQDGEDTLEQNGEIVTHGHSQNDGVDAEEGDDVRLSII